MAHRQSFGRRAPAAPSAPLRSPAVPAPQAVVETGADIGWIEQRDEELEAWKRARRRALPWRQISLMASLCFGVASWVLPDSVNAAVQWPLYGLAAISFLVGVRGRRTKA